MDQSRKEESYRRMRDQLRQSAPAAAAGYDDEALLSLIRTAVGKAQGYGIEGSAAVTKFVKLAFFAGIAFDEHPSVRQFLKMPELDPDYKVEILSQLVAEKLQQNRV
jgi:hypothetical protein